MAMTPDTLPRHELTGLDVTVADARNPDLVGISGRVLRETTNTIVLRTDDHEEPRIPKHGITMHVRLPSGTTVAIDGDRLVARPARRTETGGVSPWV